MDRGDAVLIGLPLVLAILFFNLWIIPSSVTAVELGSICLYSLGYVAFTAVWVIILWEVVVIPATKFYRLLVDISGPATQAISRLYRVYLDPLIREALRGLRRSGHQEDLQALTDQSSDKESPSTYEDSTNGDNKDCSSPRNDSGIFVDSESSSSKTDGTEELAASEEIASPPAQCQALMLYPRLHVNMPFSSGTSPEPGVTPSTPPQKFRDSITLRKEQLAGDAVVAHRVSVVTRRPRVRQFKDPPSPPKNPTLEQYTTTPGKYSKDLEEEFGDLFFGQSSPSSVSSPRRMPQSAASSPSIREISGNSAEDELEREDDSLI
ncbi:MAG: hypothetical protein LQ352_005747 [Teloschistes flavicans]|nr:MAG: hypothetical protein LQ352_005747 [Teloschistes flavicans]